MLFMAIGEALKRVDRITDGTFLARYPEVDRKGAIGFRDIIAHQYFGIDPEQVHWILARNLDAPAIHRQRWPGAIKGGVAAPSRRPAYTNGCPRELPMLQGET